MWNPYVIYDRTGFWTRENKQSMYLGLFLVLVSVTLWINAGHYSAHWAADSKYVNDIFLDNLPTLRLNFLIIPVEIAIWCASMILLSLSPKHLLFGIKALALFIIGRAFFVTLTHIGLYPTFFSPDAGELGARFYNLITFQGNFFFSGHTGFPFLMALIFWDRRNIRAIFLVLTVVCGFGVLLAHVHYSIDVFAAPFIVYGLFKITETIFPRDYALMEHPRD